MCPGAGPANCDQLVSLGVTLDGNNRPKADYRLLKPGAAESMHEETKLYFHPIFVLIPGLAIAAILGMSFAIVGTGHRKTWMLALPVVIAVWYIIEQVVAMFVHSSLFPIFWGLALPVIVSVAAWIFRRFRERHEV